MTQSLTSQMIDGVFPTKAVEVGKLSEICSQSSDNRLTADAYYLAAKWHDKQAAMCRAVAEDEPRIEAAIREKARAAATHHGASAAGLRLAATQILRTAAP